MSGKSNSLQKEYNAFADALGKRTSLYVRDNRYLSDNESLEIFDAAKEGARKRMLAKTTRLPQDTISLPLQPSDLFWLAFSAFFYGYEQHNATQNPSLFNIGMACSAWIGFMIKFFLVLTEVLSPRAESFSREFTKAFLVQDEKGDYVEVSYNEFMRSLEAKEKNIADRQKEFEIRQGELKRGYESALKKIPSKAPAKIVFDDKPVAVKTVIYQPNAKPSAGALVTPTSVTQDL